MKSRPETLTSVHVLLTWFADKDWSFGVIRRPMVIDSLNLKLNFTNPSKIGRQCTPPPQAETSGGRWQYYDGATTDGE